MGQRMIDLEHVVPSVPWISALLTLVPFGRQSSVSVCFAVLLPFVLGKGQHDLMGVGRQTLASIWTVVAHGSQLAAPRAKAVRKLGLGTDGLFSRRHRQRLEAAAPVLHSRADAFSVIANS